MSRKVMRKKWDSIFKVKVTVWAHIIKIWQFLLYLLLVLNQWVFCNLVWWCIIISQSIIQKYHFVMFKVKATIVSTRPSEILKLLLSKLVWWYIITRQGKTQWKDFLAFIQGVRQRIWLGGQWTRLLPLLAIPISKAGVSTGSNQENVERTLLL